MILIFIYVQMKFYVSDCLCWYLIMVGSIQEVDRQQQADKARIAELEATVASQQSLINNIIERLKALEKAWNHRYEMFMKHA